MTKNDGGSAFPHPKLNVDDFVQFDADNGMSFRDYVAVNAFQGLLSNPQAFKHYSNNYKKSPEDIGKTLAENAYIWADDMLNTRKRKLK